MMGNKSVEKEAKRCPICLKISCPPDRRKGNEIHCVQALILHIEASVFGSQGEGRGGEVRENASFAFID
jgi:hypothetical protein